MSKKLIAFLSILSLSLSLPLIPASAAVKAGSGCKTLGITSVTSGKTFTCIKSGKKLVWDKGTVAKSSNPDNYQSSNPDNYQSVKSDLDLCRIKETQNIARSSAKGFPIRSALSATGDLKIVIVPIDFNNAIGVGIPGDMYSDDLKKISEWSNFFSKGKLSYKPVLASKNWIRAPKGADWYTRKGEKGATSELQPSSAAPQELVTAADAYVDFTDVKFVYFVFPESAEKNFGTSIYSGGTVPVKTNEGTQLISAYGELGGAYLSADRTNIWEHLIHELLHFQGLIGHGPLNGSPLSIMENQWGNSQAIISWEGFMLGWFGESEIVCIDKNALNSPVLTTLGSIDKLDSNPISLIIRISDHEVIVIEKRTDGKFSNFAAKQHFSYLPEINNFVGKSNFTPYYIDVNTPEYRNDSEPNSDSKNFWFYIKESGNVAVRNTVSIKGVKIEIQPHDQVKVSLA